MTHTLTVTDIHVSLWLGQHPLKPLHPHWISSHLDPEIQVGVTCPSHWPSPCRWAYDPGLDNQKTSEYIRANQYLWGETARDERKEYLCLSLPLKTCKPRISVSHLLLTCGKTLLEKWSFTSGENQLRIKNRIKSGDNIVSSFEQYNSCLPLSFFFY